MAPFSCPRESLDRLMAAPPAKTRLPEERPGAAGQARRDSQMSTILSNTAVSTWKRIKVQHIALVCGLAIAASAAAAIGGWEADSATTPASPARASISTPLSDD